MMTAGFCLTYGAQIPWSVEMAFEISSADSPCAIPQLMTLVIYALSLQ